MQVDEEVRTSRTWSQQIRLEEAEGGKVGGTQAPLGSLAFISRVEEDNLMVVQQEKKKDDIILESLFGCYLDNVQKESKPGDRPCGVTQVGVNAGQALCQWLSSGNIQEMESKRRGDGMWAAKGDGRFPGFQKA